MDRIHLASFTRPENEVNDSSLCKTSLFFGYRTWIKCFFF
jgi:hypothetical protein